MTPVEPPRPAASATALDFLESLELGTEQELLAYLDLEAALGPLIICLEEWDGTGSHCGDFLAYDQATQSADTREQALRELLAVIREVVVPPCVATKEVFRRMPRQADRIGPVDWQTGETNATPEDQQRYQELIDRIQEEVWVAFVCSEEHVALALVLYRDGEHHWVYGVTHLADREPYWRDAE